MRVIGLSLFILLVFTACTRNHKVSASQRHYQLSGRVVALNAKDRTATIDAAAIPNFMEAMIMEYPVQSQTDFNALQVGEKIKATVDVAGDGSYDLSDVRRDSEK